MPDGTKGRAFVRTLRVVAPTLVLASALASSAVGMRGQSAPGSEALTLADATERALAANLSIAAARLQHPIDVARVAAAGERPNPEVVYEVEKETPRQAIGTTLPVELGGKRQRRIDLANATLAVGDATLVRLVADVRRDVRRAYFEAVAATMRAEIASELRALAVQARDAANARVVAGDVPRSDLTMSDLALAASENDLVGAGGEVAATRAQLNVLLGQPADTPLNLSDSLSTGAVTPTSDAVALAERANADVQVLDRQIEEQMARVNVAKSLTTPDVSAGGSFTYDAEPEFRYGWRASAGVTVPLFSRHRADVIAEQATLARLQHERQAVVAEIKSGIASALARAAAAHDQLVRYETTIRPLALEAERQAQAAYRGGQTGLPVLVQSLITARDTRQRGLQAGLDYQHALSDLERAIGASLK
jgi:cobalt-zinc-cadmium efflux system outer membrane protein